MPTARCSVRLALAALALAAACTEAPAAGAPGKLYVAAQSSGSVVVLDAEHLGTLATISTGGCSPHNLALTADGAHLLVTCDDLSGEQPDQLLVIDPVTDTIVGRVGFPAAAFVAHVVPSPDGADAWVSAWGQNVVHRVRLGDLTLGVEMSFPALRRPHGLRASVDGRRLYTANTEGSVSELDVATGLVLREWPLPGPAIQVAVGADAVFATVSYPPAVARLPLGGSAASSYPLPGAHELAQVTLTPDGAHLLVADQGTANRSGNRLFVVDARTGAIERSVEVGLGAHGVAVAPDGRRAWVSALFDHTVTLVDLETGRVLAVERAGHGPAGLAIWSPPR